MSNISACVCHIVPVLLGFVVRTEVSLYRQLMRKYQQGTVGCGTGRDEMFAMLEPILFEFNTVTLQEAGSIPRTDHHGISATTRSLTTWCTTRGSTGRSS